ncbi:MAG: tetratricopeptide repeat protein [Candidatus Melainabacteria bacterium]|nr:tetratricopeptide repeat protein [Candidatus Melainabacteria bacterium]
MSGFRRVCLGRMWLPYSRQVGCFAAETLVFLDSDRCHRNPCHNDPCRWHDVKQARRVFGLLLVCVAWLVGLTLFTAGVEAAGFEQPKGSRALPAAPQILTPAQPEDADESSPLAQYQAAAEQGDLDAQFNLGVFYANGLAGVVQDDAKAVYWYRLAAEQGHVLAQLNLGVMYANGRGVLQNGLQAVEWYQKAALQNNAEAKYNLGLLYEHGKGVAPNPKEAIRWYQQAAEQGYVAAQLNLGVLYASDDDTIQDLEQALHWLGQAAELGEANAQYNLGILYAHGRGVEKSEVQAYQWVALSVLHASDPEQQAEFKRVLGLIEKRLDEPQRQAAQEAVNAWQKSFEQKNASQPLPSTINAEP